jgi:hypothetical protein
MLVVVLVSALMICRVYDSMTSCVYLLFCVVFVITMMQDVLK